MHSIKSVFLKIPKQIKQWQIKKILQSKQHHRHPIDTQLIIQCNYSCTYLVIQLQFVIGFTLKEFINLIINKDQNSKGIFIYNYCIYNFISKILQHFEKLPYDLVKNLFSLGFDSPTPIQQQAIPLLQSGKNIIASAPTGTGKTGAFAIAAFLSTNAASETLQVIIISPTRELCAQTAQQVKLITKLPTGLCTNAEEFKEIKQQIQKRELRVLVCTFTKLKQLGQEIDYGHLHLVVIDEADELTGKPELQTFLGILKHRKIQLAFFSATYTFEGLETIRATTTIDAEVHIQPEQNSERPQLKHYVLSIEDEDDRPDLLCKILGRVPFVQCIVFVNTQERCELALHAAQRAQFNAVPLHAGLPVNERVSSLRKFQSGRARVLVATDLFGRGMDARSVTLIVHFDLPKESELFTHRSGRAGRQGREGAVVSFENKGEQKVRGWCQQQGYEVDVL